MRPPTDYTSIDKDDFECKVLSHLGCRRVDYENLSEEDLDLLLAYWYMMQHEVMMHKQASSHIGKSIPPVYVDFYSSLSLGAVVFPRQWGGYWMAVADRSHAAIAIAFSQLFRHRKLFLDIGDASVESNEAPIIILNSKVVVDKSATELQPWESTFYPFDNTNQIIRLVQTLKHPNDPTRQGAYLLCLALFYHFLTFHEMGHIYLNHFNILRSQGELENNLAFYEISDSPPPKCLTASMSHLLELEADQWAMYQMLGKLKGSGNLLQINHNIGKDDFDLNNPVIQLRLFFIVHTVFSAIFANKFELKQYNKMRHPHPDVRFHYLFAQFQQHTDLWVKTGLITETVVEQIYEAIPMIVSDTHSLRDFLTISQSSSEKNKLKSYSNKEYLKEIQFQIETVSHSLDRIRH